MKTLKLKVKERRGIIRLLNETQAKGGLDLVGLRTAMKLVEKIKLTEKEVKGLEYKTDEETKMVTWKSDKDVDVDIELNSDQEKMLRELISGRDKDKLLSLNDMFILNLAEQLGIIDKEK